MRAHRVATVILTLVFMAAGHTPLGAGRAVAASGDEEAIAAQVVAVANRERAERGIPELAVEERARVTATDWARQMRDRGALGHRPDLAAEYRDYPGYGEIVGSGARIRDVHGVWMSSPEHARNLLQPGFDGVGVGVACGDDGTMWVAVDLLARTAEAARRFREDAPVSPSRVEAPGTGCAPGALPPSQTPGAPGVDRWLLTRDGEVLAFGSARFFGSARDLRLSQPVVGMVPTPGRTGYWLVARDGGVFAFGDAPFVGSMGGERLNQPIVGMAATPSGLGYWLVARDGGVFALGDAPFLGSAAATTLAQPVVAMAAPTSGAGYWLVEGNGSVLTFGAAPSLGSREALSLDQPVVGMAAASSGRGYWLVTGEGEVVSFDPGSPPAWYPGPAEPRPVVAAAA